MPEFEACGPVLTPYLGTGCKLFPEDNKWVALALAN